MLGGKTKETADLGNKRNQIENGTRIVGDIETTGSIRIDGAIEGNVTSQSKVVFGPTGKLTGTLVAVTAEIAGEINGKATVSELLSLKSTAVMNADVEYGKIMIEEGAALNGTTRMAGAVVKDISSGNRRKDRSADESGKGEAKLA